MLNALAVAAAGTLAVVVICHAGRRAVLTGAIALLATAGAPAIAGATPVANFNRETYSYSSVFSTAAEANLYDTIVLQSTDAGLVPQLKAANPHLRVLLYEGIMAANIAASYNTCTVGSTDLATNPNWLLYNQYGHPITVAGTSYLIDVGVAGYQQACLSTAISVAKQGQFDGIYWDMVNPSLRWNVPSGTSVPKYTSDTAWQAAMYSMLQYAGAQLHAQGLLNYGNIGGSYVYPGLWQQWNGPLDGAEIEGFTDNGTGLAAGTWGWPKELPEVAWSEANHKQVLLKSYNTTEAGNTYGLASMMLVADGESTYSTANACYGSCETWYPEYFTAAHLGLPTGNYARLSNGAYYRAFQNGMVLVNPSKSSISSFGLGGATYTGSGLSHVSSVAMAPTSGYILLRDPGSLAPASPPAIIASASTPASGTPTATVAAQGTSTAAAASRTSGAAASRSKAAAPRRRAHSAPRRLRRRHAVHRCGLTKVRHSHRFGKRTPRRAVLSCQASRTHRHHKRKHAVLVLRPW